MIDICFGDSERGMLQTALKKRDVLLGYSMLDLGRLAAPDLPSARRQWIDEFFSICSEPRRHRIFQEEQEQVNSILSRAKDGDIPRIWVASCPRSRCGLFQLVYALQDIAETVCVVELPGDTGYQEGGTDRSWGEADPFSAANCLPRQRELTGAERTHFSACWEKLVSENAALRINEGGQIRSVPIDYLDDEIYSFSPDGEITPTKAAAEMIGRSKHIVTDAFVYGRIEAMIEAGRYEVVGNAKPGAGRSGEALIKKTHHSR